MTQTKQQEVIVALLILSQSPQNQISNTEKHSAEHGTITCFCGLKLENIDFSAPSSEQNGSSAEPFGSVAAPAFLQLDRCFWRWRQEAKHCVYPDR